MNKFKELRLEQNLSQKKLAEILKISQSVICDYENGKVVPTATVTCLYADYFSVTTDYLLGREDDLGNIISSKYFSPETEDEKKLISAFRLLDDYEKESLIIQATALSNKKLMPKK
ncbi:MAG: helix-turn-helix transcriptional regulator [Clostridia bacterium]|nr:helix-turn-helix transcriptional regulator [Clostridia bacterium]